MGGKEGAGGEGGGTHAMHNRIHMTIDGGGKGREKTRRRRGRVKEEARQGGGGGRKGRGAFCDTESKYVSEIYVPEEAFGGSGRGGGVAAAGRTKRKALASPAVYKLFTYTSAAQQVQTFLFRWSILKKQYGVHETVVECTRLIIFQASDIIVVTPPELYACVLRANSSATLPRSVIT